MKISQESYRIIESALRSMMGDDLERARMAFRHCTPEQMKEQYGFSGKTRQEVLDGYEAHRAKLTRALEEFREVCKP